MTSPEIASPRCPITGEPAVRLVQWVKRSFLEKLWRYMFKVDARRELAGVERFGLWESPIGLCFFDPPIEGSHEFYTRFYSSFRLFQDWSKDVSRPEFQIAARHIAPGHRVLDVGCGFANFRHVVPQAHYTGLDPHFAEVSGIAEVRNQTLRDHLADHAGFYDAACAFQVLEHLVAPGVMFADMLRAVRPGGLVIIGVPHHPSPYTGFPNLVLNAPPHHLTWWTERALAALAERKIGRAHV